MSSASRLAVSATVIATVLTGCTLFDSRYVYLALFSPSPVDLQLVVKIEGTGVDRVRLELDGTPAGTFTLGALVTLDTSHLLEGEHRVTANAVSARPVASYTLAFQVLGSPPGVTFNPPGGAVRGDVPLSILLEFTEPVQFDGTAGPLDLYPALRWPDAQPGVTRRPAPDGRSIRFDVAYPGAVTSLALRGQVQTARGGKLAFNQWIPVWTVNALMGGFDRSLVVARAPGPPGGVNKPYLATIALVAFLDAAPGGGARLRAASLELGQGAWVDVPGDLDLGLGPPSEPAILMMEPPTSLDWVPTLAWVEDGQVRLRMGTIDPTGLSFGPALSLNHDPESPARAARLVSTPGGAAALVFVETGPTGDELWARRWDGTDWVLHPGPINAGTDDTVRDLAVGSAPGLLAVVAWTDAEGQIYLRVLNL